MKMGQAQPENPAFSRNKTRLPRFDGYTGGKVWNVGHPAFGNCLVVAPSIPAAIVVAARVWRQCWTEYRFYSECKVAFKGDRKKLILPGSAVI